MNRKYSYTIFVMGIVASLFLASCAKPTEVLKETEAPVVVETVATATAVATEQEEREVVVEKPELLMYINVGMAEAVESVISPIIKEKYGVTLIVEAKLASEQAAVVLAQQSKPEVTLTCAGGGAAELATIAAGLYIPLDFSKLPNAQGLYDIFKAPHLGGYGIGYAGGTAVIQYYTPIFKENGWDPPKGYADLADPKYKGRVGLTSATSTVASYMIDILSKNAGAPKGDVTPGIEFAQQLVAAGQVHSFPTKSNMVNELMETGEIWIATQWSDGAFQFVADGGPVGVVIPEEGAYLITNACFIVKGAPNQDVAYEVINLVLSEEFQQQLTNDRLIFPARPIENMPATLAGVVPATPEQMAAYKQVDWNEWAEYRKGWIDTWMKTVEGKQ